MVLYYPASVCVFRDLGFTNKKERGGGDGRLLVYHNAYNTSTRGTLSSNYLYHPPPAPRVAQSAYGRNIFLAREHTRSFRILCAAREITFERSRCFDYLPRNYSASRWREKNIAIVKDFISACTLRFLYFGLRHSHYDSTPINWRKLPVSWKMSTGDFTIDRVCMINIKILDALLLTFL